MVFFVKKPWTLVWNFRAEHIILNIKNYLNGLSVILVIKSIMCHNVLQSKDSHTITLENHFFFFSKYTQGSGYEYAVYSIIIIIVQTLHISTMKLKTIKPKEIVVSPCCHSNNKK